MRSETETRIVRWADICRVMYLTGHMDDFPKGEYLRVHKLLDARVQSGKVIRVARGRYASGSREDAADAFDPDQEG